MRTRVGVLALQGCIAQHQPHIEAAGGVYQTVRTINDLNSVDALILPGGESSTMLLLIEQSGLEAALVKFFKEKPVWGICAGAILLAKEVLNPMQKSFGVFDITIERNGYGRQMQSSQEQLNNQAIAYIRAPRVTRYASSITVCHTYHGDPVWLKDKKNMITTFHPELSSEYPSFIHQMFVDQCLG